MSFARELWLWPAVVCVQFSLGCGFDALVDGPPAGNPDGPCPVPVEAAADVSKPDHIVGDGTKESCTSDSFLTALVARPYEITRTRKRSRNSQASSSWARWPFSPRQLSEQLPASSDARS